MNKSCCEVPIERKKLFSEELESWGGPPIKSVGRHTDKHTTSIPIYSRARERER
jgi:uncharacterized phage-associated protein